MTDSQQPSPNVLPAELYGLFAGTIDQAAVQRFHNAITLASTGGVKHIHLLFQCSGGLIGEGISLYNLFRISPIELTLYNVGSISSIGVIAYLGAKNRRISKYATFMIHRAYISPAMATSERLQAATDQLTMEDERIEAILKLHLNIPQEKWEIHKFADLWISYKDAISYGFGAQGEFAPPAGMRLFNVWPPMN